MFKQITTLFSFLLLFFLFSFINIEAKEYCSLYLDNELHTTVELPFYYYELERFATIQGSNMPTINYTKNEQYIDSTTKCKLIKKDIIYTDFNMDFASISDYSTSKILLENHEHFVVAKIKENNKRLIGLSSIKDEEPPEISNYNTLYYSNVDFPINLEHLISTFTATDNLDGNVSSKLVIERDDYTKSKNIPGKYLVILSATDSENNKSSISFYIQCVDKNPPKITGDNYFDTLLSSPINLDNIKNLLEANDNVDNNISENIFVCEDLYSKFSTIPGIYNAYFCAYDSSENLSDSFKVTINVIDDIAPVIEGPTYFDSYLSNPLLVNDLYTYIAASDNGKDVSGSIFLVEDNYSNTINKIGNKTVILSAMDENNNISKNFIITINLIDDIAPQIFGLDNFESKLSSPLSLTKIKQQLTVIDNIDGNISSNIEIVNDSYSNNINNKGFFYITFKALDSSNNSSQDFKVTIKNIDDIPPYFKGPNELEYKLSQKPSINQIISQYRAIDNIDTNLEIEIEEDNYSSSMSTGIFFVIISSTDSENNKSLPYSIKINVVEKIINIKTCIVSLSNNNLYSIDKIIKLVNLNEPYKLIENTYSDSYTIPGQYLITLELENNDKIEIHVEVYENTANEQKEQKKETFWSKFKRFFKNIFYEIKKFFKNLFW